MNASFTPFWKELTCLNTAVAVVGEGTPFQIIDGEDIRRYIDALGAGAEAVRSPFPFESGVCGSTSVSTFYGSTPTRFSTLCPDISS